MKESFSIAPPSSEDQRLLTTRQAAERLGMSEDKLLALCRGYKPKIPVFWLSPRLPRFHMPTILAKLRADAGIPNT